MSILTNVEDWLGREVPIIEADVWTFIQKVEADVQIALADAQKFEVAVAGFVPQIAAGLTALETFIAANPGIVAAAPQVAAGIAAANIAMVGLNAFAANINSQTAGGAAPTAQQVVTNVVTGFQAAQAAKAAISSASAAALAATKTATAASA